MYLIPPAMQDDNILIDQLEDQLIDNPDESTTKQLNESSYDETFQRKLNERANQLFLGDKSDDTTGTGLIQFLVTKPVLVYEYSDLASLQQELAEWFTFSDLKVLGLTELTSTGIEQVGSIRDMDLTMENVHLDALTYYVLGQYASTSSTEAQLRAISSNCRNVVSTGLHRDAFSLLVKCFDHCIKAGELNSPVSSVFSSNYFKILTVVYTIVSVALDSNLDISGALFDHNLLLESVRFIDKWNQFASPTLRIRNVLLLFWKLILVEFGSHSHLEKVDKFLVAKHNIKNKDRKNLTNSSLTCSPLDYYTFRENLMDKYPMYSSENSGIAAPTTNSDTSTTENVFEDPSRPALLKRESSFMAVNTYSNSLSNLLEMPRTNKSHTILSQLPIQTVHIATPVPSPPTTPSDFMSGGEKIRKQYHVNQGVPFVYPVGSQQEVPEAVREALDLLENAVYESYSIKRMWDERQRFMAQERGNIDQYSEDLLPDVDQNILESSDSSFQYEIRSLRRIEKFYGSALVHFHGLVAVLLGVMKSNKFDFNLRDAELEFDPETGFTSRFGSDGLHKVQNAILQRLELVHQKEIALKASSAILDLLLRWFKASHVLKYQYFSSLLFDQQFFSIFVDLLGDSFNNAELQNSKEDNKGIALYDIFTSQNKLMNPAIHIPQFDFFNNCQNKVPPFGPMVLINKTPTAKLQTLVDEENHQIVRITRYNRNFCFTLVNLLHVTNKILIKNILQRIFVFNETKPTDLLKIVLLNYVNDALRIPILKIFKKLVPYQGRKWRALNMDVISLIYLHLKLSLKDNWLSGKDLECDFNNSFDQEIALRSLLQFYNIRKYPKQMLSLGYALTPETIPQVDLDESLYS